MGRGWFKWKIVGAEGRWFDSTSSRHVETLGKSFTRNCLYDALVTACAVLWRCRNCRSLFIMTDVAPCDCLAAKFDSCNKPIRHVVAQAHWVGSKPIRK